MNELAVNLDLLVGTVIQDRYRFVSRIGKGGTGEVFMVEHTLVGRRYALKVLNEALAKSPTVIARFHREARAAAAVGNAHIVEVVDMGYLDNGLPYLVMELLEGRDLYAELSQEGPLSIGRAVDIATQCCEALEAAHKKGIVHRDMKPENVFITKREDETDFIKILDFGISKVLEAAKEPKTDRLTWDGAPMGTPQYMSLEQLNGCGDVDFQTDVYATGVVLFEMLTGHLPFEAPTFAGLVTKIANEAPPSLVKWRPDIPPALEAAIHRSLAKNRQERFSSMAEMAEAIAPFSSETSRVIIPTATNRASTLPGVVSQPPEALDENPQGSAASELEPDANGRSTLPGIGSQPPEPIGENPEASADIDEAIASLGLPKTKLRSAGGLIGAVAVVAAIIFALAHSKDGNKAPKTPDIPPAASAKPNLSVANTVHDRAAAARSSEKSTLSNETEALSPDTPRATSPLKPDRHPAAVSNDQDRSENSTKKRSVGVNAKKRPRNQTDRVDQPRLKSAAPSIVSPVLTKRQSSKEEQRQVKVQNAVRATVNISFKCKTTSRTVKVAPRGQASATLPFESCQVSCTGMGRPVCPSHLNADAVVLEIH
ncbi:MAG: protein kinase [Deltaproteobacteria bacterium]|nr:protein kinase [Deltaproteobacteria bacterium]